MFFVKVYGSFKYIFIIIYTTQQNQQKMKIQTITIHSNEFNKYISNFDDI